MCCTFWKPSSFVTKSVSYSSLNITHARRSSFLSRLIRTYIYLVFVLRLDVRRVDLLGLSAAFFSLLKNMTAMDAKSNANCIVRLPTGSLRKVMWK